MGSPRTRKRQDSSDDEWVDQYRDWLITHGSRLPVQVPPTSVLGGPIPPSLAGQGHQFDAVNGPPYPARLDPHDLLNGTSSDPCVPSISSPQEDEINVDSDTPENANDSRHNAMLTRTPRTAKQTQTRYGSGTTRTRPSDVQHIAKSLVSRKPPAVETTEPLASPLADDPCLNSHADSITGLRGVQDQTLARHGQEPTQNVDDPNDVPSFRKVQHLDGSWSCRQDGCSNQSKRYNLLSELTKHQRNHEKKPFFCNQCNFSARFAGHLASHQQGVHEQAIHYCHQCGKSYKQYHNLQRHHHKKHRGIEVPKKEVASTEPAALDAQMPSYQSGLNPTVNEWYPGAPVESMVAASSPSSRNGYLAATLVRTKTHALGPRADARITYIASLALHGGEFATLQPTDANKRSRPPSYTPPISKADAANLQWPALPQAPSVASSSGITSPNWFHSVSNACLPTPSPSGGSSIVEHRIRSENGASRLLPATPSAQWPSFSRPSYSDVTNVNLPTPPSSQPSGSHYSNSTGHRLSAQRPNQGFEQQYSPSYQCGEN
ncbi:hypothetical protein LTR97_012551 [Elasticomyces elasticus]|uniref:C2H2-type domain-containing protein n=1 Tax=Elasticomyces elasticus TaxID=574655 RepID=A0AAN7ZQF1_9PEZI|nr:hypothetical protein LTR97_012551 [Elasticomyces elasticus]